MLTAFDATFAFAPPTLRKKCVHPTWPQHWLHKSNFQSTQAKFQVSILQLFAFKVKINEIKKDINIRHTLNTHWGKNSNFFHLKMNFELLGQIVCNMNLQLQSNLIFIRGILPLIKIKLGDCKVFDIEIKIWSTSSFFNLALFRIFIQFTLRWKPKILGLIQFLLSLHS